MKALDTNTLVRFLVADDQTQARLVRDAFVDLERSGERFMITSLVLLELLSQMPVLDLTRQGNSTKADLSDILIGLAGRSCGCEGTLTFDKRLTSTGLFERL